MQKILCQGSSPNFNDQCSHHKETSQLICRANQLTGFYIKGTLVVKRLSEFEPTNKLVFSPNSLEYPRQRGNRRQLICLMLTY